MNRLLENQKLDNALLPQSLNGAATGAWLPIAGFRRGAVVVTAGAIAQDATVVVDIMRAQDDQGTGAEAIPGATVTLTGEVGGSASGIVAAEVEHFDVGLGFSHFAARVTTSVAIQVAAVAMRGASHQAPAQGFSPIAA